MEVTVVVFDQGGAAMPDPEAWATRKQAKESLEAFGFVYDGQYEDYLTLEGTIAILYTVQVKGA